MDIYDNSVMQKRSISRILTHLSMVLAALAVVALIRFQEKTAKDVAAIDRGFVVSTLQP